MKKPYKNPLLQKITSKKPQKRKVVFKEKENIAAMSTPLAKRIIEKNPEIIRDILSFSKGNLSRLDRANYLIERTSSLNDFSLTVRIGKSDEKFIMKRKIVRGNQTDLYELSKILNGLESIGVNVVFPEYSFGSTRGESFAVFKDRNLITLSQAKKSGLITSKGIKKIDADLVSLNVYLRNRLEKENRNKGFKDRALKVDFSFKEALLFDPMTFQLHVFLPQIITLEEALKRGKRFTSVDYQK
jgi:hypothetical protein